jgi:hypothetical protein
MKEKGMLRKMSRKTRKKINKKRVHLFYMEYPLVN